MWLTAQKQEMLIAFLRHCPCMIMAAGLGGEIYWANEAFCEWSGYTESELRALGWIRLSVDDGSLQADRETAKQLDNYRLFYTVQKQYIPKNDKPQWGTLTVMRWPDRGEIECCLCVWEPLKNGTATAFALAKEEISKMNHTFAELRSEIKAVTAQNLPQRIALAAAEVIVTYPKACGMVGLVIALLIGGNQLALAIHNARQFISGNPPEF